MDSWKWGSHGSATGYTTTTTYSTEPERESDYRRRDCAKWRQKRETFFSDPEPGLTKLPE